jgi:hypothetical protein
MELDQKGKWRSWRMGEGNEMKSNQIEMKSAEF